MKFKKFVVIQIILSLLLIGPVSSYAETASTDTPATTSTEPDAFNASKKALKAVAEAPVINEGATLIENWNSGDLGVHKELAKPISKELLARAGKPGFFISKFLNYRKQLSSPTCTMSQKLSYAANLLTLAGDVVLFVLTTKQNKALQNKFKEKISVVENYSKNHDLTQTTEKSKEAPDVQMMAFDYSIEKEEQELKRLKVLQSFKYPALALHLGSNILNAKEALAEASSSGTAAAAANTCMTAQKAKTTATTAAVDAASSKASNAAPAAPGEAPWYVKPFMWLGEKFDAVKNSSIVQGARENIKELREKKQEIYQYKKGIDAEKSGKEYAYTSKDGSVVNGMSAANSASYAEEMIVGVIFQLKKPSEYGKNKIVNSLGKDAEVIAIRYVVRKMVKANIEIVDKFMRSAVGRHVVYAYNIWVLYSEFDQMQAQVKVVKQKIAKLKEIRARLGGVTSWTLPGFKEEYALAQKIFADLIAGEAWAEIIPSSEYRVEKMCLGAESCDQKFQFLDENTNAYFRKLSPGAQDAQQIFLSESYTLKQVNAVMAGKISVSDLDLNKVAAEIKVRESQVEQHHKLLLKKGILKKDDLSKFEKTIIGNDYKAYAPLMKEGFHREELYASLAPVDFPKMEARKDEAKTVPLSSAAEEKKTEVILQSTNEAKENNPDAKFDINFIQSDKVDIWQVIHSRYMKHYHRLIDSN